MVLERWQETAKTRGGRRLLGGSSVPPPQHGAMDVQSLLAGAGPWALGVIALLVFIESGLLFPFLPGDSLLVTAGLAHQQLGL
jgi:hypothetical protein